MAGVPQPFGNEAERKGVPHRGHWRFATQVSCCRLDVAGAWLRFVCRRWPADGTIRLTDGIRAQARGEVVWRTWMEGRESHVGREPNAYPLLVVGPFEVVRSSESIEPFVVLSCSRYS